MFREQILEAAKHLYQLVVTMGLNTLVHCTSGISRSPAVVIVYLCLFLKNERWQYPGEVKAFVDQFHKMGMPNMEAVEDVIANNKHLQDEEALRIQK